MPRVKIRVSQECIDNGIPGKNDGCAIKLAIEKTPFPGIGIPSYVRVNEYGASFISNAKRMKFLLPVRAYRFVRVFDRMGKHAVKPFSFFADLLPERP